MKEKALIELTAKEAAIIMQLLPTVRISGELSNAMEMAKLKLQVDEIIQNIQKAFGEETQVPAEPKRRRH